MNNPEKPEDLPEELYTDNFFPFFLVLGVYLVAIAWLFLGLFGCAARRQLAYVEKPSLIGLSNSVVAATDNLSHAATTVTSTQGSVTNAQTSVQKAQADAAALAKVQSLTTNDVAAWGYYQDGLAQLANTTTQLSIEQENLVSTASDLDLVMKALAAAKNEIAEDQVKIDALATNYSLALSQNAALKTQLLSATAGEKAAEKRADVILYALAALGGLWALRETKLMIVSPVAFPESLIVPVVAFIIGAAVSWTFGYVALTWLSQFIPDFSSIGSSVSGAFGSLKHLIP